jgi:galactokinase
MPFPVGYTFVLASSGVAAEKTGAALELYNRQSRLVSALLELWRESTGRDDATLAEVVASAPDAVPRLREMTAGTEHPQFSGEQLVTRLDHFLAENIQIIPAAGDALAASDMEQFGRLVDASQRAAEQLLGNQVPQTVYLATQARELGAVAASSFGAGFGGSVWAIVANEQAESFQHRWAAAYRERFPAFADLARVIPSRAGPAAFVL